MKKYLQLLLAIWLAPETNACHQTTQSFYCKPYQSNYVVTTDYDFNFFTAQTTVTNSNTIIQADFDLQYANVQTSCSYSFSVTGDAGCSSAARVTGSGQSYLLSLNPTAVALSLNCNIQCIKRGQGGIPTSYRVIPFQINVSVTCTAKIQKCSDVTCTTVTNYASGTQTSIQQNVALVQYFKMTATDATCYDDAYTQWDLTNNPANDCTQTITPPTFNTRIVTLSTLCTTPIAVTTGITLNVEVLNWHTCDTTTTPLTPETTGCSNLPNCCDSPKYRAQTDQQFKVAPACTAKLQVCPIGDLVCIDPQDFTSIPTVTYLIEVTQQLSQSFRIVMNYEQCYSQNNIIWDFTNSYPGSNPLLGSDCDWSQNTSVDNRVYQIITSCVSQIENIVNLTLAVQQTGSLPISTMSVNFSQNIKCEVTSYQLTGCSALADYTVLDAARTDSCITITQVPACGYDSTLIIAGIPASIMTGSVSSTTNVNLATYTTNNALAATYNFSVTGTLSGYPTTPAPTSTFLVSLLVKKCVVNSYTLAGCSSLPNYTVLDTTRTDSCITITQVPACGYDSTLLIAGIPTSIMTGSVSSTTIVDLATYTADKSLADTYTVTVTATLSDYPYSPISTAPHAVSILVIDPCTTTTIPAQAPSIPTIGQFAGFIKAVGQITFQDTFSTANAVITGQNSFCGPIQWSFEINGAATNELTGTNTNGTIIFAPSKSINPGNKRNANLRATLTDYQSIFCDNTFQVITYTATLQTPKDQNYTISDRPKSFQIDTNTDFQPQSPQIPFNTKWKICYQMNFQVNLTYPLDTTLVQCSMDWVTYPTGYWQIFSTDNTIAQAKPYHAILLQSFPDFVFNDTTPTQFAQFTLNVTAPPVNLAPYLPGLISNQTIQQCLKSPTVNWSYTLPTAIDAEGDPVTYNVTLNVNKIYYEESSRSLIQFGFYSQPKKETVLIELSDNHGNKAKYKMVLTFRCDNDTTPIVAVETVAAKKVITANITNVTDEGNVTITFSSNLTIPKVNLTDFPTLNVTVQGKLVPSLQLSIEPGVDTSQKYLEFSWTMIEFNTNNLTLNLNFTFPRMVSKNKIKDYLYAQINDDLLFSDRQGNTITQGYELQLRQIPKQKVTASGDQKAIGAVVSSTLTTAMAGNAVVQLLLSGSLSSLLGCLDQLQVMTHLQLMNLNYPQNSQTFYTYLINIIMMEPVSIDSELVSVLKLDQTEPLSPNFAILSYSTLYPTRNLGFNCLWYMAFPTGLFVCWILRLAFKNCKKQREFLTKIRNKYLTNGLVLFLNSTYLCSCVSFCISTYYMRFDSLGNNVNSLFSVLLAFVIILFPIFVGVFYTQNFQKIVRQDRKFLSKWGSLIEPLNFKRRGRKVIVQPVFSLMRKLILAVTLVFAQNAPIIVTIFCCMIQVLIIIYFIGGLEPMKNKGDNKMLLLNETFVMLNVYCQICYTDFNGDLDATVTMGNVLILITVTNIAINILRMLYLSANTIFRKLKLYCLKRKHQKMVNARLELKRQVEFRINMRQLSVYRKKQQGMLFRNIIVDRNEIIRSYAISQELLQGQQLTLKKDQVAGQTGNLDRQIAVKAEGTGTTQKGNSTLIKVKPRFNTMQRQNNQLIPMSPTFGNSVPVSNVDRRARHNDFDTLGEKREQDQVFKARKANYNSVVQATMNEFRAKGKRRLQQEESQNIELQNNFFAQKELPVTDPKYIKWRDQKYIDYPSLRDFEP